MDTDRGFDDAVWKELVAEIGLGGIHVPTEFGGAGLSFVEVCIVLEEMGSSLFCAPFFSSNVLASSAILCAATDSQRAELLPPIVSGDVLATVAFAEDTRGCWDAGGITMECEGGRLSGEKLYVLDGVSADQFVVVAREQQNAGTQPVAFYLVDANARGLERKLLKTLDATRKQARIRFDDVPAVRLGEDEYPERGFDEFLVSATAAISAEMVGGAQRLLDSAVSYAKERVQFGREIGSMQAIKHKCADLLLTVEMAKSAAYYAANAVADMADDRRAAASIAKSAASDAYMQAASDCIQVHGGIGFTWEQDTHLWYKRAKTSEMFLGDSSYHRELLLQSWDV